MKAPKPNKVVIKFYSRLHPSPYTILLLSHYQTSFSPIAIVCSWKFVTKSPRKKFYKLGWNQTDKYNNIEKDWKIYILKNIDRQLSKNKFIQTSNHRKIDKPNPIE